MRPAGYIVCEAHIERRRRISKIPLGIYIAALCPLGHNAKTEGFYLFGYASDLVSTEKLFGVAEAYLRLVIVAITAEGIIYVTCIALKGYLEELLEDTVECDNDSTYSYDSTYNDK